MECIYKSSERHIHSKFVVVVLFFFLLWSNSLSAQTDSIQLKNGDLIVGQLKEMKQNIALFETDYSDSDFKIKWSEVKKVKTQTIYLITLSAGKRYTGHLESVSYDMVSVINQNDTLVRSKIDDIVFLKKIDFDFWSNLNVSLSIGYNFTKANNLSQYSVRSHLGYRAERWSVLSRYNHIISAQSDVSSTQRLDANLIYNRFLKNNWFLLGEVNWLSNTAQNIDLRTVSKAGLGKYIIQTNSLYWGLQTGISFNNESFSVEGQNTYNNSSEAFLGTEVNLYDIGDLNLLSRVVVYPSLTESGRWRTDFNLDVKYDLPLDFFINFGISLNYDNQPIRGGSETDYIFQTTVGWSL